MGVFMRPGDVFLADCPARLAIELVADKWSVVVIYGLSQGPRRHNELKALIGGVSSKVLAQTMRRLQRHGLVGRSALPEQPSIAQYELTPLGQTLVEPVEMLSRWAEQHGSDVLQAQGEQAGAVAVTSE
ncbi:helix-turn-helix domain-containing protein [Micromonospora sp. NPDC049101]|uniref:winged helix-turn-helix transcriptional regulator n=1 Tax=unclassified Micromonospora TaxID=2617518 RepID=UPI0033E0E516